MSKSQTKILYLITQSDFGGAQKYVYDLATNISQNYTVIVAGGQQGERGELAQKLKEKNIKYVYIPHLKRAILPWHDFLAFRQIVKLIKQEKPDIVHLNSSKISIIGSLATRWCRVPKIIYTVHGWVFNEELSWWKKTFYKILEKWTAKYKNQIICLSEFDKKTAIQKKITPANKISVIYNGIKPIKFLSREEAREKLNVPKDIVVIGSIGNLYSNKGHEYLIKTFEILNIKYLILNIIGEGPRRDSLELKINTASKNIKLLGSLENASRYLSAFDIYVCSSIKEGLPYTILEAMQAGLPIISTNVGAIPEVITDGKEGLLVEPKNPEALAKKIQYLIDNPEIAKQLGEQVKKDVAKKFSLKKMIEKTEEIYNK
ncbi:MAG: glycosyltransferase family 4 protein [Patescibacteria group bacterium]|jgi:glycosyltransferase involved in cell wall biosynthesis